MSGRKLPFYELICAHLNINFMLKFEAKDLMRDDLVQAIKLVKRRHPYTRMRIRKNEDSSMEFYEENETEFNEIYLDAFQIDNPGEFDGQWAERLIKIANAPRDNSKSLSFFELHSCGQQHQLLGEINHSGIDGPGVFTLVKDLCGALDDLLSKKLSPQELEEKFRSRKFCEIHNEYKNHSFDLDELKSEQLIKENFVKGAELRTDPSESDVIPRVGSKFFKLDEQATQKLLANTKKHNSTIQGLLSAAHMIALVNDKPELAGQESLRVINAVPCNMRETLEPKLTNDDMVCGSAALIWPQEVHVQSDNLWSLAQAATRSIKELRASNYGTKWWIKLGSMLETQPYSIMCSSMGVVSLSGETALENLQILDLRFMGASYATQPNTPGIMTHAFSFENKFTFNFSFTHPALSESWADKFSRNIYNLLVLASTDEQAADKKSVADLLALLA